jgi:four helix bundle protein
VIHQEIPLFAKIYQLYQLLYQTNKKFPKRDRYALGLRLENCCLDLLELIIAASNSTKSKKLSYLEKANIKLEVLKVFLRTANESRLLTTKKYVALEETLQEIGKMLGGWIRYQNRG